MHLKVFEFLGKEVPSSIGDIREVLDLLATFYRYCDRTSRRKSKVIN